MKKLYMYGSVINVFTGEIEQTNVLIEGDKIIGVGDYTEDDIDIDYDEVYEIKGMYICPGLIDGHIHIESTMMIPSEFARTCIPHGTTTVIADPHEIANVCGKVGIDYMIQASEGIPLTIYYMLPSCVPATQFDEAGAKLEAEDLLPMYYQDRVLGLGEMMNYVGVISKDKLVIKKINDAIKNKKLVNGHAPLLMGKDLDKYISAGINDDHECSTAEEAIARLKKGQWIMIREGTAARNLEGLLPLFHEPYAHRCLLVTDDKHPADLLKNGHIDSIIREATSAGVSVITAIKMATIQAAECFGLRGVGAIAPGYKADMLILDDIDSMSIMDVIYHGEKVVEGRKLIDFDNPTVRPEIRKTVKNSFYLNELTKRDFKIESKGSKCRVIGVIPKQLITEERQLDIHWGEDNGVDIKRDILKLAVIERHLCTGHVGLGFIQGIGLGKGAIASSVAHDSHNLIVIGTNEEDMVVAANRIRKIGGGNVVVCDGKVLAEMPLPVAGLMSTQPAEEIAKQNSTVREMAKQLGSNEGIEPFMNMAFVSLPVIPYLKMTTLGLVDVIKQEVVSLYCE